jgi:hypothetical protein
MDFIERLLGISPDGGNGSTEVIVLAAIAFVAVALLRWSHLRRLSARRPD